MAHRLQLALVAASKEVILIHQFFTKLSSIITIIGASCKRSDQLKAAHAENIAYLLAMDELESGTWLNQVCNLQRAEDTLWSSYLRSVSSLINMFSATCEILMIIIDDGATSTQRADADTTYEVLTSYEFVFTLHLVMKVLEITDLLCRTLQLKSQDILNAMDVVKSTKTMIRELRDEGWADLIKNVNTFCESISIPVPNLDDHYIARRGKARHQQEDITMEHHYKVDIFNALVDTQLHELNSKFNDHAMELLTLSSALDSKEMRNSFRIDDICTLVGKYYPQDFAGHEEAQLKVQFKHFGHMIESPNFQELSTISDLCKWMSLILTLPVSTATMERSFSAMNIIKNKLRNKIADEFLSDSLLVCIEKEIAEAIDVESI
ncbi:uncharacterized protein, partial [Rutidosis leptorrhynchoides]|uniref:uncharacterized protein n=1 Tax=Rutidosis leptorrhynchoides TaxID=125765 RepID=UPI003A991C49